ncbi:MAG: emp24/gp25L/p24 family protein [Gammaproteobacteria bacterium]|nr:emp24/gp25L/p24 family protein [Gammaproteobacteria bacterium]MBU1777550.1 emp24/gp25L/p24 family protein [Gammaproteobacteria bacterium]MBU1969034.1 emp24/gp25L/p24 family protein [Gammaproteobacteria bacterium]
MKTGLLIPLFLALAYGQTLAADGNITINSPANGALVSADSKVSVNYEAMLGPKGDHMHLYVDGKRIEVLRQLKGNFELDALNPGKHKICLTENTKWHMSTGMENCVEVIAQ